MDIVKLFAEVSGLSVFIMAAVAQLKQFGVVGKALTFSAYGVGLVIGGAYRFFVHPPTVPVDWFWLVLFGCAGGFIATGVYKAVESATGGALMKQTFIPAELKEFDHAHDEQ